MSFLSEAFKVMFDAFYSFLSTLLIALGFMLFGFNVIFVLAQWIPFTVGMGLAGLVLMGLGFFLYFEAKWFTGVVMQFSHFVHGIFVSTGRTSLTVPQKKKSV